MARKCPLTGKKPMAGNNVAHSNKRTKRRQLPNIQTKKLYIPEENRWVRVKLSTSALRNVSKKGLLNYLKEQGLTLKQVQV